MGVKYEKMSKSRGNSISVDEVVHGVCILDPICEFRFKNGNIIDDFKSLGVWKDPTSNMYFTATRYGKKPVFLHYLGNPEPAKLLINGKEIAQHETADSPAN